MGYFPSFKQPGSPGSETMPSWTEIKAKILENAKAKEKAQNAKADAMKAVLRDYPAVPGKKQDDPWWVGLKEDEIKTISCQLGVPMPTQEERDKWKRSKGSPQDAKSEDAVEDANKSAGNQDPLASMSAQLKTQAANLGLQLKATGSPYVYVVKKQRKPRRDKGLSKADRDEIATLRDMERYED